MIEDKEENNTNQEDRLEIDGVSITLKLTQSFSSKLTHLFYKNTIILL